MQKAAYRTYCNAHHRGEALAEAEKYAVVQTPQYQWVVFVKLYSITIPVTEGKVNGFLSENVILLHYRCQFVKGTQLRQMGVFISLVRGHIGPEPVGDLGVHRLLETLELNLRRSQSL